MDPYSWLAARIDESASGARAPGNSIAASRSVDALVQAVLVLRGRSSTGLVFGMTTDALVISDAQRIELTERARAALVALHQTLSNEGAISRLTALDKAADACGLPELQLPEWQRRLMEVVAAGAHDDLLELLPEVFGEGAERLLKVLNAAEIRVPTAQIVRLLHVARPEAIEAAGNSGDQSLGPQIRPFLNERGLGPLVAFALAKLRQTEFASDIATKLGETEGLDAGWYAVALERMGDPSVVPQLLGFLGDDQRKNAFDIRHAVWRLTGREPLDPSSNAAWRALDFTMPARPTITRVEIGASSRSATFDLVDGLGILRLDYRAATRISTWPRWSVALFLADRELYDVGSHCGTCETMLTLTGSLPDDVARAASAVRATVRDVQHLDEDVIRSLTPYIATMRTGRYVAHLDDWAIDRVERPEDSWLNRRYESRPTEDSSADLEVADWPGTEHFQLAAPALGDSPTYGVILPIAALSNLNPRTVDEYAARILAGERPTALTMSWVETKSPQGEGSERFLIGALIDGHHKLAAYARVGRPARILSLSRLGDSGGGPEALHEAHRVLDERNRLGHA